MAGGVPSSATRRGSAAYRPPPDNVGRPHFHPSTPLPSRTSPLDARLPMEEDRSFCAFDVTTWPSRVWNEGASGVIIDLRCAYQCWQQDNEQVKLAFDNLVEWISALEGLQDPPDRIMNLGRSLLNTFRMQLTIASDPDILFSKLRARLYTAVHQTDAYARAAQLFVDRLETQRTVRCQQCHTYGHEASTCNVRPRGNYSQYRRPSKNGRGAAARSSGMLATAAPSNPPPPTNPHRQRTAPPTLHPIFQIARRNRREGQWSLSVNDARLWYDESPTSPLWAGYMRKANEVAREMWAPSTWMRGMSLAGQFTNFLPHAQKADERGELCGLFDGNRCGAIDPTAVRQDAAVNVGNGSNPAGHDDSGVTKNCGAIGEESSVPRDRGRDESIYPQPERLEVTRCFSTCVDNGESFV
ncbi:hypothetical protein TcBrA4_0124930 [Trypanosoma cruzi]|nr:hypothetical protein TcBrA4_0124930 [Trypanosoma cruzi]